MNAHADEFGRGLRALNFDWNNVTLMPGMTEVNFSRMMASLYVRHHYNEQVMQAVLAGFMTGFEIDVRDNASDLVPVGPKNLRMSLFLLWLALNENKAVAPGSAITFAVTEEHIKKAETFFDGITCVDARNLARTDHGNLRRFFKKGAVVTVYLAQVT
jgi:hypothetical protein